jgi:hypothetical protein
VTISIFVVDRHFVEGTTLFNPNAFPGHVKAEALACGDRLAILAHSVGILMREPVLDRSRLVREIRENKAFEGYSPRPDKPSVLILHNLNFVVGLNSALVAMKSFLDLYARLVAKLLVPSANLFGFNKASFKGQRLAGGRLLNWIEDSAPQSFEHRDELVAVLSRHIDRWVGQAVEYRDAAVHHGAIPGITEAYVPLNKAIDQIDESDVVLPRMPDGEPVSTYGETLLRHVREIAAETLRLMPGVDLALLAIDP